MRKRWLLLSIAYNMETLFVGEYIYYGHRQLIRAQLVSQLIRVQLVLLDWGSNQQNL